MQSVYFSQIGERPQKSWTNRHRLLTRRAGRLFQPELPLFPVGIRRTASRRQTARQHQMVRRCQMLRQHQTARRWQTVRQRQIVRRHRMDRLRKQASQRSRDTMIRITSGKTVQEKRAHQMKIRGMLAEPGGRRIHRDRAVVLLHRKRTELKVQRTVDAPLPVKRRPNRRNRNPLSRQKRQNRRIRQLRRQFHQRHRTGRRRRPKPKTTVRCRSLVLLCWHTWTS